MSLMLQCFCSRLRGRKVCKWRCKWGVNDAVTRAALRNGVASKRGARIKDKSMACVCI